MCSMYYIVLVTNENIYAYIIIFKKMIKIQVYFSL
jgi:hypothetical protein